jgi:uncharacterized protein YndB with AHSA1/START domain
MSGIVATAEIDIAASPAQVWRTLTDPAEVKEWMFGTDLVTDWRVGGPVAWKGEYQGNQYEDKGEVLTYDEPHVLAVTHFSPTTGQADLPENYHTVTWVLTADGDGTHLALSQDNNGSDEEAERSKANWDQALQGVKARAEG